MFTMKYYNFYQKQCEKLGIKCTSEGYSNFKQLVLQEEKRFIQKYKQ